MDTNYLAHYGTPRHSGRYPYGSGEKPFQHESSFLDNYNTYKDSGMSEIEIARAMNMSTKELRERKAIEKENLKAAQYSEAIRLKDLGWSNVAIGERLDIPESSVRNLLNPVKQERTRKNEVTTRLLKDSVDSQTYIDIGPGSASMLGTTDTQLNIAVRKLKDEGYRVQYLEVEQAGIPGQYTTVKVLTKPDVTYKEIYENRDKIGFPMENMNVAALREKRGDASKSALGIEKPVSVSSDRIAIRYAEEGGKSKDGVIELRRGVSDISLGNSHYAQVRIAVDDTHYLKGMALYSDNLPDGVDILFNTNKPQGTAKMDVLKKMKTNKDGSVNWENPFGSTLEMKDGKIVGQHHYIDANGKDKLSAINIVRSEGSWNTWSNTLASQFLSKQPQPLINQQLKKTLADKEDEFDSICKLTNPEIKKKLLDQFANDCDASSAHLKAAALPRQSSKVILPLIDISENEIYAPTYHDGEQVVLIRYPHGGTFELPVLTVNNKNKDGKRTIGAQAIDAVGINAKVAERLSGADFDGDTVVVIPTASAGQKIKTKKPLEGLKDFDPTEQYGPNSYKGKTIKIMSEANKQNEMGKVSNLITDMTLQGATDDELARAVRHSMVVIDAVKHELDYKQSFEDNGIRELKIKYQGGPNKGASTLISQANADSRIPEYKEKYGTVRSADEDKWYKSIKDINVLTDDEKKRYKTLERKLAPDEYKDYLEGKKIYYNTGETYKKITKSGDVVEKERLSKVPRMYLHENAFDLSSGTPQETAYANYANAMKQLANEARKVYRNTPNSKYNPSAKETYKQEVDSLNSKLNVAISNKPLERQAQLIADVTIKTTRKDNPDMSKDEIKKLRTQALAAARARTGASKSDRTIKITDKEWEAIQAGAISSNKLNQILDNTDIDVVKQRATPRSSNELNNSQIQRIKSLADSGYTLSEISSSIGVSVNTVEKYLE